VTTAASVAAEGPEAASAGESCAIAVEGFSASVPETAITQATA
jgi:hypothetical protein